MAKWLECGTLQLLYRFIFIGTDSQKNISFLLSQCWDIVLIFVSLDNTLKCANEYLLGPKTEIYPISPMRRNGLYAPHGNGTQMNRTSDQAVNVKSQMIGLYT